MLAQQEIATIRRLYYNDRQSIKKIALQLGISRNTVRRWIRKESSTPVYSPQRQFLIENREEIRQLFLQCEGNCLPLNRQIKFRWNITIHIRMLERFCEEFRREVKESQEPNIRFETLPGQQLQVDFGEKDVLINNQVTRVHLFVAKLGFSRRIYAKAYYAENQDAWLDGLESCFKFFGGVPYSVVSDNSTCLVRNHNAQRYQRFTERYQAFCNHYSIIPIATAIRKPRSKGKVENAVKYVKNNALPGMSFGSLSSLNLWLEKWTITESDYRKLDDFIPGLKIPIERFNLEKNQLKPLTQMKFMHLREEFRKVSSAGLIRIDSDFYRVPDDFANKEVQVLISDTTITVTRAGSPVIELDKVKEVYPPQTQEVNANDRDWLDRLEQQRIETAAYHNNPLQRSTQDYDFVWGDY